jgi:hypothetical protein
MSEQPFIEVNPGAMRRFTFQTRKGQRSPLRRQSHELARSILVTLGLPDLPQNKRILQNAIIRLAEQSDRGDDLKLTTCETHDPNPVLVSAFGTLGVTNKEKRTELAYYAAGRLLRCIQQHNHRPFNHGNGLPPHISRRLAETDHQLQHWVEEDVVAAKQRAAASQDSDQVDRRPDMSHRSRAQYSA